MSGWVAGAVVVGAIGGAVISSNAAKSAADTQAQAGANATAESARQFNITQANQQPWLESGQNALKQINTLNSGDYSSFQASPDYQFTRSEGQRDLGNSFAAKGGAASGNALRALSQYNQNLASGQYNSYYNKIAGVAGVGQSTATNMANQSQAYSNNYSQNQQYQGDARASGIVGQGNSWSNALGTIGNYGLYMQQQQPKSTWLSGGY